MRQPLTVGELLLKLSLINSKRVITLEQVSYMSLGETKQDWALWANSASDGPELIASGPLESSEPRLESQTMERQVAELLIEN